MPHIHDLIDFIVDAYIVYENRVLLILHKKLKLWLPVGGHIELNEDPDEALVREIKEECGLEVKILANRLDRNDPNHKHLHTPSYLNIHKIGSNPDEVHRHVALIYFAKAQSDKFVLNADEHDNIRWFSDEELCDPKYDILPIVQFYAREALKRASEYD